MVEGVLTGKRKRALAVSLFVQFRGCGGFRRTWCTHAADSEAGDPISARFYLAWTITPSNGRKAFGSKMRDGWRKPA